MSVLPSGAAVVTLCMTFLFSPIAQAQVRPTQAEARGLVVAGAQATVATDLSAKVIDLPHRPGESFKAGELLIAFDCARYDAEFRQAEAELRAAASELSVSQRLHARGAAGTAELAVAEAKRDGAAARVDAAAARRAPCRITAPYDGWVVARHISEHEMPSANAPLLDIVSTRGHEIDVIVPSAWLPWLHVGTPMTFLVDETNFALQAQVSRLGAVVDPISQTMRIHAALNVEIGDVRPGMSGTARFRPPSF